MMTTSTWNFIFRPPWRRDDEGSCLVGVASLGIIRNRQGPASYFLESVSLEVSPWIRRWLELEHGQIFQGREVVRDEWTF